MEEYRRIRNSLLDKQDKLEAICRRQEQAAHDAGRQNDEKIKQIESEYEKVKAKIARANAYLTMAEAKKCDHIEPKQGKSFDNVIMAQLAVQLNSVDGRVCASRLYTEARAQKMELEHIASVYENQISCLSVQNNPEKSLKGDFSEEINALKCMINSYFHSKDFTEFKKNATCLTHIFSGQKRLCESRDNMAIGSIPLDIFTAGVGEEVFEDWTRVDFSGGRALAIPLTYDMAKGQVFLVEFEPVNEAFVIAGLQNVLYNFLLHRDSDVKQILMVDSVRNNDTALGALAEICELSTSPVSRVPRDPAQIRQVVGSLLETLKEEERHRKNSYEDRETADRLVVFHNFPVGYDSEQIRWIQELCVSARHYGIVIFVTFNKAAEVNKMVREAINMITGYATCIYSDKNRFYVEGITEKPTEFVWFAAPPSLTEEEIKFFRINDGAKVLNNRYEHNVEISSAPQYLKGKRSLDYIPYGLDEDGMLQTLDFEDANFAYYICGASRSGKSTLLHTIISGILATTHPDDVEIWLVDFKKTEFSRYIEHLPPHIRYIVLDESPELVYDIINRLTEILRKRQNLFMGKWEKLSQVPSSKYMPEIFVVIDEFSKMSQVLSDSVLGSGGDYTIKLQNLLTAGAAFGFKFIFSSQDFSEGTRGLTATAKKQIQQRIAMYSKVKGEIKETLGLAAASDSDVRMMENLKVHHTLMKIPEDNEGNHLKLAKPLFFAEKEIEFDFIDKINKAVHPVQKYFAEDADGYIFKKPLIIDGNSYTAFSVKRAEIQKEILSKQEENETLISLGDPKRLLSVHLVRILDSYGENILMVASANEAECAASIVYTVDATIKMQGKITHLWAYKRSGIYKKIVAVDSPFGDHADTIEEVCREIKELKEKIDKKIIGNDFYFLFGIDSYMADMAYLPPKSNDIKETSAAGKNTYNGDIVFEARKDGEMDIISQLKSLQADKSYYPLTNGDNTEIMSERQRKMSDEVKDETVTSSSGEYDAREDLKYILTQGPRFGYHFFTVFTALQEIKQSKIRFDDFKHRVLFKTSKTEAAEIMNTANAGIVQSLDDHAFRYSNGIEALNFRPYIHEGLIWSGMKASGEEEEEYLM